MRCAWRVVASERLGAERLAPSANRSRYCTVWSRRTSAVYPVSIQWCASCSLFRQSQSAFREKRDTLFLLKVAVRTFPSYLGAKIVDVFSHRRDFGKNLN